MIGNSYDSKPTD